MTGTVARAVSPTPSMAMVDGSPAGKGLAGYGGSGAGPYRMAPVFIHDGGDLAALPVAQDEDAPGALGRARRVAASARGLDGTEAEAGRGVQ